MLTIILTIVGLITGFILGLIFSSRMYYRMKVRPEVIARLNQHKFHMDKSVFNADNEREQGRSGTNYYNAMMNEYHQSKAKWDELRWVLTIDTEQE